MPQKKSKPAKKEARTESFDELGLDPEIVATLTTLGYEEPTPIQREAIPHLLDGRDLLGQAGTGTGKTAAFALPIIAVMDGPRTGTGRKPFALVLVPTRELAVQVSEAIHRYGQSASVRVLPLYGGQPFGRQLTTLKAGVDVVVATPGRALDHLQRGTLKLDELGIVVLDEADEMLDMGFVEDIEAILAETPESRQTLLFSATMPARIAGLAKRHLQDPVRIAIESERTEAGEAPRVREVAYVVGRAHKLATLGRVLDIESPTAAIVFCRTRNEVDELTVALSGRGYRAEALHGGMSQDQRERVMARLRAGTAELLIATDVAARGLDIDVLTHVFNYDVPSAPDAYVHRTGRVGRAGREGVAITLAEPREHAMLKNIERVTGRHIAVQKVPTVADLHARRLEIVRALLRETILADGHEHVRVVVESLADEFDVMEVAMAAVKLVADAEGGAENDEADIPDASISTRARDTGKGSGKWNKDKAGDGAKGRREGGPASRIYIGAGRDAGIRPQDIVGAIANEAGLPGKQIGAIQISERFTLVEVPDAAAAGVIAALRQTTIKGKKVTVRADKAGR
jgi:ATP-dependent RNA helicase DeaD